MIDFLKNLNLEDFGKDEETYGGLVRLATQEGKVQPGYSGDLYINYEPGDAQLVVRVCRDGDKLKFVGMDIHAAGCGLWDVVVSGVNVDFKEKDRLEKRILVHGLDGKGMAVLTLVNSDVLPSINAGDKLKLQVAAFPVDLDYFSNEDEYIESLDKNRFGQTYGLADGFMMPVGVFRNGNMEKENKEDIDDETWGYMLVKGTVKHLIKGEIKFMDEEFSPFVRCLIETQFGDLEIVHSFQQVKEEQRDNFKVGSVVRCLCFLSADPSIKEFDDGAVYDEENDLLLYRDAVIRQSQERIETAIADNAVYVSGNGTVYEGKADIVERMKFIYKARTEDDLHTKGFMATITEPKEAMEELEYCKGKRCLIIAYEEDEYAYSAIAFIDTNEEGKIKRLTVSKNPRYRFKVDEVYTCDEVDDYFCGVKDPTETMFARGRVCGFVNSDEEEYKNELMRSALKNSVYKVVAANAEKYIDLENGGPEELHRIAASLFTRAYEEEHAKRMGIRYERPDLEEDVLGEKAIQPIIDVGNEDFEAAARTGRIMGNDLLILKSYDDKEEATRVLQKSLVFIQELGRCYERALIKEE